MNIRNEFADEEWQLVATAPAMVGIAIAAASPNGPYGLMKEMMSVSLALQEIVQKGSSNPIIEALIEDVKHRRSRSDAPLIKSTTPEDAQKVAIGNLRKLSEILYRKPLSESHVEDFKRWLIAVAQRVAEAASEGGFLGIGGVQVSDDERAMIRQITFALGLPTQPSY